MCAAGKTGRRHGTAGEGSLASGGSHNDPWLSGTAGWLGQPSAFVWLGAAGRDLHEPRSAAKTFVMGIFGFVCQGACKRLELLRVPGNRVQVKLRCDYV